MRGFREPQVNIPGVGKVGVISAVIIVLAGIIIFRLVRGFARNIISTPPPPPQPAPLESMQGDKFQAAFDPDFWQRYEGSQRLISAARASQLAESFYNAKGFFDDDEDLVRNTIMAAGSIANMSRIARQFQTRYNRSLLNHLLSFLNSREMSTYVIGPIESLRWL